MPSLLVVTTVPVTLRSFLLPFAASFREQGWRVDAMARDVASCPECVEAYDHVWDVDWARNPLDPSNWRKAPRAIQRIIEQEHYDIVHVHTPVAAFVTRFALRRARRDRGPKVIYTAHGFHFYRGGRRLKNLIFLALEKLAGRWTDHLVVINDEDFAAARRFRLVAPERVVRIPGIGIDTTLYDPAKVGDAQVTDVRASLGLAPRTPLFLMVAELIPRKRPQDALQALAQLDRTDAHLAIAGVGPLLPALFRDADELGITDRVHFLGARRDIPVLARASTALLLVSRQEGLPRSVMEALALEVPVIATDIRGTRDLLADGSGKLVPEGDIPRLVDAMTWVLEHPTEAKTMAAEGRQKMQGDFEESAILVAHEKLYAAALAETSTAG